MVGGTSTASASTVISQPSPVRANTPSSTSIRTSSRTNSGLPSVDSGRSAVISGGNDSAPSSRAASSSVAAASSPSSETTAEMRRPCSVSAGADLTDLGACECHDQDRRITHPLDEMVEQVQEQRLGPLDVVDHQKNWDRWAPRTSSRRRTAKNASSVDRAVVAPTKLPRRSITRARSGSASPTTRPTAASASDAP